MLPYFSEKSHWTYPTFPDFVKSAESGYTIANEYPVGHRGLTYTYGYIGIKRLGAGQMYLISIRDKDGNALHGKNQNRLHVPPDAPVKRYWSVTAYDRETHALIRGMSRASRSSQIADLQKNPDGSIDLYIGPKAPPGKESNWIPTDRTRAFELMFRAYGPTPALFEKKWVLPDVEKMPMR